MPGGAILALAACTADAEGRIARGEITNGTFAAYRCNVVLVTPFFAKMKVSEITTPMVQGMVDALMPALSAYALKHTVDVLGR